MKKDLHVFLNKVEVKVSSISSITMGKTRRRI